MKPRPAKVKFTLHRDKVYVLGKVLRSQAFPKYIERTMSCGFVGRTSGRQQKQGQNLPQNVHFEIGVPYLDGHSFMFLCPWGTRASG